MAKGPLVTDVVEALIAKIYDDHPKWKAPEVRKEVDFLLHKKNSKLPPKWPSLSTVQKVLAIVRKKKKELSHDPQEKPWSTATLVKYPELGIELPTPEALAAVLRVWKFRIGKVPTFTIREAKWVARFSAIYQENTEGLFYCAYQYASKELMFQFIDRPFDSMQLDKLLVEPVGGGYDFKFYVAMEVIDSEDFRKGQKGGESK